MTDHTPRRSPAAAFIRGTAVVLGAGALWLLGVTAGFGGAALAVAGIAATELPPWWRILAVAVGSGAAVCAAVIEFSHTPRRGWLIGALAGLVGSIVLAVLATTV